MLYEIKGNYLYINGKKEFNLGPYGAFSFDGRYLILRKTKKRFSINADDFIKKGSAYLKKSFIKAEKSFGHRMRVIS